MPLCTSRSSLGVPIRVPSIQPLSPRLSCSTPTTRERELGRYVVMCRQFAQDIATHRGWKGDFPSPSSSEQAEAAAEAAAALEQQQGQQPA